MNNYFSWRSYMPPDISMTDIPDIVLQELYQYPLDGIPISADDNQWSVVLSKIGEDKSKWSNSNLAVAINHLTHPEGWHNSNEPFGPESPTGINYIMMYFHLNKCSINIHKNITGEELLQLWDLNNCNKEYLLAYISRALNQNRLDKSTLVQIAAMIPRITLPEGYDYHDIDYIASGEAYIRPVCNNSAIVIAAKEYNVDLTIASDPLIEFYHLKSQMDSSNEYVPSDVNMLRYPNSWDLCKSFNPELPPNVYQYTTLLRLIYEEGYTEDEVHDMNIYNKLTDITTSENFYFGSYPKMQRYSIIDMNESHEVNDADIICYGIRDESLKWITISELLTYWRQYQRLWNPFTDKPFTTQHQRKFHTWLYINNNTELIRQYTILQTETQSTTNEIRQILDLPDSYDILSKLWNLTMYLRGWNGKSQVPIEHAPRIHQVEPMIEERYAEIVIQIYQHPVLNLPLINFDGINYYPAEMTEGNNIRERLDIINQGEHYQNTLSCIRVSSNILANTINYYSTLINKPLFVPGELAIISD